MYEKAMAVEIEGNDYYHVLLEDAVLALMFTADEIKAMIDPAGYTGLCSLIAEEMAGKANGKAAELKK